MEKISRNEISFLIVLMASEESRLWEIIEEFEKWDCNKPDVLSGLANLIEDGIILLSKPIGETFDDFTKNESLLMVKTWNQLNTQEVMLFLTEPGYKRWEIDDWGITTKRARHLMFAKSSKLSRAKNA